MKLSTKQTASFAEWFATLQQVAMHEFSLQINEQEANEYFDFFQNGLNQNEALGS